MTGAQIERAKARDRGQMKVSLTDTQFDELESRLHSLTVSRQDILEVMGLALDNADAAEEVCVA